VCCKKIGDLRDVNIYNEGSRAEYRCQGAIDANEEHPMGEGRREWTEEFRVAGNRVVDRIRELIHEGNVRKIIVKKGDGTVLKEFTLTQGTAVGGLLVLLAPGLAALGAIVAFAADIRIQVVRDGEPPAETPADPAGEE
jgi:hypothetical protein